jgi:hypothetical protein
MAMSLRKPVSESDTFPAHEMILGELYMTAQSPKPKQVPCRLEKIDYVKKQVLVSPWYQNLGEWGSVWVDWNYKIRHIKQEEKMKLKSDKAKAKEVKPGRERKTAGKTSGVGVFATWAVAFKKHGGDPKAVASFMHSEYPSRDTNWTKWVDAMRQRYNRGLLTDGDKPGTPIPPYKAKAEKKSKGE